MFMDSTEACREARRAVEAQALGRSAEGRAHAAAANARAAVVTCSGCKAAEQGGDWGQANCRELRAVGLCQRQVYLRVTMARLVVELVRALGEAQASEDLVREMVGELRTSLGEGCAGILGPGEDGP
jgi:hypothetical protein